MDTSREFFAPKIASTTSAIIPNRVHAPQTKVDKYRFVQCILVLVEYFLAPLEHEQQLLRSEFY